MSIEKNSYNWRVLFLLFYLTAFTKLSYAQPAQTVNTFQVSSEMIGKYLRVVVIGGGGGGSGATADGWIARLGAGGGSGGINSLEMKVSRPGIVEFEIGKGGDGGAAFGAFVGLPRLGNVNPHGREGGKTYAILPNGERVVAVGGRGGFNIASSYKSGLEYTVLTPPIGGLGGTPNGGRGGDGIPTHKFSSVGISIDGGASGTISGILYGSGGAGGGAATLSAFPATGNPIATPYNGDKGKDGHIEIDISDIPFPPLEYHTDANVDGEIDPYFGSEPEVQQFFKPMIDFCQQDPVCAKDFLNDIQAASGMKNLAFADRFKLMSRGNDSGFTSFIMRFITVQLPEIIEIVPYFILNATGDARRPGPNDIPIPNPDFINYNKARLNELIGFCVIGINNNMYRGGKVNREVTIVLRSLRKAAQEELRIREKYSIGEKYLPVNRSPGSNAPTGGGVHDQLPRGPNNPTNSIPGGIGTRTPGVSQCNHCGRMGNVIFCMTSSPGLCIMPK